MERGLYIAGTGMLTERNRMDVITNNITNVDTLGYKKDYVLSRSFSDMLLDRVNDPAVLSRTVNVGPLNTGIHIDEVSTDFSAGLPEQTDEPTDLMITGNGFFVVSTPDGDRYTRAGNFTTNADGDLLDANGYYVQDQSGSSINVGTDDFVVNKDGSIYGSNGEEIAALKVVTFKDTSGLRKAGNNLYYHYKNEQPVEAEDYKVTQGYIETSNVNIASEMVDMIITNRAYETSQSVLKMIDQTLGLAVNDIAKF